MSEKQNKRNRTNQAVLAKQLLAAQEYMTVRESNPMYQYQELLQSILNYGQQREDRTGVGTVSLFAPAQMRFNLNKGFPLVGVKKVSLKNVAAELLWMLSGSTNTKDLKAILPSCKIWDAWADKDGDLGKIYGYQWRKADGIDQVAKLIAGIKGDPFSRRHIVNSWNVRDLPEMALTPCHNEFQCYVSKANDGGVNYLSLRVGVRSNDFFIGTPYNIAQYALLTHLIARATGLRVGELVYIATGDAHIYLAHLEQVKTLLQRTPPAMPKLIIKTDNTDIDGYNLNDFALDGYTHLGELKGEIAV